MKNNMPLMKRLVVAGPTKSMAMALGLCVFAGHTLAENVSDIPPTLFETRFIKEGDPAATTSKCIGNPITPICAVDTRYGGSFYKEDELREIAYGKRPPAKKLLTPPPYNPYFFCYQIIGYWVYQKEDRIYETQSFLKPGDVAIEVREGVAKQTADGQPVAGECNLHAWGRPFRGFLLRRGPYGWYIYGDHHMIDFVRRPEPYRGMGK